MRYQLVLQWFSTLALEEFDGLIEVENLLLEKLHEQHAVDGHDAGSGEMNIFILTDDPRLCFEEVKAICESRNDWQSVRVAYREISQNEKYVILFPAYLTEFSVT
jgi:hypothetical protein